MIVSHKFRFIFIKTRKTAGTSIEMYLANLCGPDDVVTPIGEPGHPARNHTGLIEPFREIRAGYPATGTLRDLLTRRRFYNHIAAGRVRARLPKRVWDGYLKFCVERDPWDKTLSHFAFLSQREGGPRTLDEYLERGMLCVDTPLYTETRDHRRLIVDRVLRYEALDDELDSIFGEVGVPFRKPLLERAKASVRTDRRPYREVFTPDQRHHVAQAFRREIELFGYTYDDGNRAPDTSSGG